MSTYCRKCAMGSPPDEHDCVRNHDGSAKAMEPRAAVQLCLNNPDFKEANVRVSTIVADRDASTFAALNAESDRPINRLVDLNHNTKGINNQLYELKKSFSWLTTDTIEYLKRCVNNGIKQNKNNVEGVRSAILNVARHVYDEHEDCGEWCKAKGQPDYPFKNLPKMKPLSDPVFRVHLEELLGEQAAESAQLAACGSTQANENFNHMSTTRAPKSRFYGGTKALKTRVASAVCAKNIGATYTEEIFSSTQLSPSVTKYRQSLQKSIELKREYQQLPHVKKRRLQLKLQDRWQEARELSSGGITYASGMGSVMERAVAATSAATSEDLITSWIPPISELHPDCAFVYLDLETTGFQADCDIIQVAAVCGSLQYSAYMVPSRKIAPQASAVTGLKVVKGKLVHKSVALPTKPPRIVASEFLEFLRKCGPQVILVGHNLMRYDAPRILRFMKLFGESMEFAEMVHGLVETMPLIRQGRKCKLQVLAAKYLTEEKWTEHKKNAHNAVSDCILLEGLMHHFSVSQQTMLKSLVTMVDFMKNQVFLKNKNRLGKGLSVLEAGGVSKHMITKMAGAGVTLDELKDVMLTKGTAGFGPCLGVQIYGKPRVTSTKDIIAKIAASVRQVLEKAGVDLPYL
ncbi:uncharacterized protein LOC117645885 [Thrips palmi]|uniref:Uncharacterized protein LOC117645885 n=1 Tax=Thrips palmi TaxID=161013 RepID=A0A6P8Z6H3_THRPL|nr:uncharacterized protein LOC117645885 [Thrips palmi]